jgi:galactonate dehydratase
MRILRRARLSALALQSDTRAHAAGEHAISDVRAWTLREPVSKRRYSVLRLDTAGGVRGYGECIELPASEVAEARRILAGIAATAVEPARARLSAWPQLQAAANMALLDIAGKLAKAPVYQVLGGPTRNKARALAPLAGDTDAALRASLDAARATGHRAFLVPAPAAPARNHGQAFVRAVRSRMEALRAAAEDCDFVLAGGGALTPGDAASISAELERFHMLWFDEPCAASNLAAVRKLAAENVTPLGFGATVHDAGGFQDLLRENAIDVVRPSLARHGITQIRRIAALAETYYIAVAPHHAGGPVGTVAALHLAASLPNFFIQQAPFPEAEADRRMRSEIAGGELETVTSGYFALPTGPGLGISVNEEALDRYQERAA